MHLRFARRDVRAFKYRVNRRPVGCHMGRRRKNPSAMCTRAAFFLHRSADPSDSSRADSSRRRFAAPAWAWASLRLKGDAAGGRAGMPRFRASSSAAPGKSSSSWGHRCSVRGFPPQRLCLRIEISVLQGCHSAFHQPLPVVRSTEAAAPSFTHARSVCCLHIYSPAAATNKHMGRQPLHL